MKVQTTGTGGRELIKKYEGLPKLNAENKYPPYLCPADYWTLGYGSRTGLDGLQVTERTPGITIIQAEELLTKTLWAFERDVRKLVTVPLTQGQFDALVSFAYNLGAANLQSSTLLKKLNAKDYEGAAKEFLRWDKATVKGVLKVLPGLTKRRQAEMTLFLS